MSPILARVLISAGRWVRFVIPDTPVERTRVTRGVIRPPRARRLAALGSFRNLVRVRRPPVEESYASSGPCSSRQEQRAAIRCGYAMGKYWRKNLGVVVIAE